MTSKLIVNSLAADTGVSTITFADQAKMGNAIFHSTGFTIGDSFLHSTGVNITNINATGVITATKFVGEVSVGSSITFEDNEKAYFGTGTDFSIYHNGSASYLDETGTGGLIVKTDTAFQVFNSAGSQPAFTVTPGGGIDLYHNTTKMLETTAIGLTINGDVKIIDNENLRLGTGNDMLLYHTGSHSYIENSTGNMYIRGGGGQILMRANSAEDGIVIKPDGAVELYHNNTKRLETFDNSPFVGVSVAYDVVLNSSGDSAYRWAVGGNASSNFKWSMFYSNSSSSLNIFDNVNSRTAASFKETGVIELNHSGTKVVETTGSGLNFNQGSGNLIKYGTTSEFPHAAININRGGNGYANIRLSSNYGCGLFMAGASNNTDEFSINQDNQKNGYVDNRGGFISFNTGSSGTQRMKIENSAQITFMGNLFPSSDNSYDMGSGVKRWRNIYTADLHCSNKGSSNDVDGTWGDYTIQEGESDLFLINNRSGKKYKFNLTEVS